MRFIVLAAFRAAIWLAYRAYKVEGINGLLNVLPAKLIVPTLRKHGASIGDDAIMHSPLIIHNAGVAPEQHYRNLKIGARCYFGREVFLDLKDNIIVEDNVTISMRVTLITHTDVGESPLREMGFQPTQAPIVLRRGAYIGAGALILQGVEIGESAFVGAGAVVLDDVPPRTVAVGVPAKPIRDIEKRELEIVEDRTGNP